MTEERPAVRLGAIGLGAVAAVFAIVAIIPRGEYQPIRRDERGTVRQLAQAIGRTATGKPSVSRAPKPSTTTPPTSTVPRSGPTATSSPTDTNTGGTATTSPSNATTPTPSTPTA